MQSKCSWRWAKLSPETCRASLKESVKQILPLSCCLLISLYYLWTVTQKWSSSMRCLRRKIQTTVRDWATLHKDYGGVKVQFHALLTSVLGGGDGQFYPQKKKSQALTFGLGVVKKKGKSVPLQAWTGPEGSRKLRLTDFVTTAQDGGKVVSLTHRPPLPSGNAPGTHFC